MSKSPGKKNHGSIFIYLIGIGALVLTLLGVWGIGARRSSHAGAEARSRLQELERGPRVRVTRVIESPSRRSLVLQGEARPFLTVTLYAKVSGYLRNMNVDKGDRVRANQVIATITSPELDQQYLAGLADARNKRANARRFESLAPSGVISRQDLDLAGASADVAEATSASLANQRDYRVIRAPFDGVVTARFADPGALIQSAANGQSGAIPIATVSKTDRLRIYVYLDQQSAAFVHVGDPAQVRLPERAGFSRAARVTRMSGELAPRTRTMLTEIDVDNLDGVILSGSFVEVALDIRTPTHPEIPAEALVMRGDKPFVAVVDEGDRIHYRLVGVADDDGKTVRLVDGARPGERVALNVGSQVEDGAAVRVVPAAPLPSAPVGAGGASPR